MGSSETCTVRAVSISSYGLTPCVHVFISSTPSADVLGRFSNPARAYIHHVPGAGQPRVLLSVQAVGLKCNANLSVLNQWLWKDPGKAVMCLTFLFGFSGSCFEVFMGLFFFSFFKGGGFSGLFLFSSLFFFCFLFPHRWVIFNLDQFPDVIHFTVTQIVVLAQQREQQELAEGAVTAHSSSCTGRKTP